jgi:hypothetical protein
MASKEGMPITAESLVILKELVPSHDRFYNIDPEALRKNRI